MKYACTCAVLGADTKMYLRAAFYWYQCLLVPVLCVVVTLTQFECCVYALVCMRKV